MLSHWSNDKLVHETEIFQKENKQLIEVWVDFLHSTREIGCKICSLYDLQIVEMVVLMLLCTLLDSSAKEHGHLSKVWEEVDLTLREHQTIPKQVTRGEQPARQLLASKEPKGSKNHWESELFELGGTF